MTIKSMINNLRKKGLDARPVTMCDGSTGIMVYHDYNGPYPTREALQACDMAEAYARRNGYKAEARGYYTGTFIWEAV